MLFEINIWLYEYYAAVSLTVWDFLVRVQVFVNIHGEIHHVCVAEEVQLPLEKFLFIVDLWQWKKQTQSLYKQLYQTEIKIKKKKKKKHLGISASCLRSLTAEIHANTLGKLNKELISQSSNDNISFRHYVHLLQLQLTLHQHSNIKD